MSDCQGFRELGGGEGGNSWWNTKDFYSSETIRNASIMLDTSHSTFLQTLKTYQEKTVMESMDFFLDRF